MSNNQNRIVEVCDSCMRASCWHGDDLCQDARGGTIKVTVRQLNKIKAEHPSNYSVKNIEKVYGETYPHGFIKDLGDE